MGLDSLMLTRMQQLIYKKGDKHSISKEILLSDKFDQNFLNHAVKEEYIFLKDNQYYMTDKLRYMPITIAKFKLDSKEQGNKYNDDDPKFIESTFKAAKEYHLAGTVLLKKLSVNFEGEDFLLMEPVCVLAALSAELYLKTLLLKHAIYKKGHKLKELFEFLPEEVKQNIIFQFEERGELKDKFLLELDEASETFVVIRYHNEISGICYNPSFLGVLIEVLYNTCVKIMSKGGDRNSLKKMN